VADRFLLPIIPLSYRQTEPVRVQDGGMYVSDGNGITDSVEREDIVA
jgi:hypothetical protein